MAQFLLDTHTLIWHLTDAPELSPKAKQTIENAENQAFVSIASFWEIAIKINIGKLNLNYSLQELLTESEKLGFEILDLRQSHLLTLINIPLHHRDPFDRILIAQSIAESMTLISKDTNFPLYDIMLLW
jgi:PIN domain nuclease of toxin-antitoxin system